jgi:hypothetical protein
MYNESEVGRELTMDITDKMVWTDARGAYASGKVLNVGFVKVGSASYSGFVSKNDPKRYKGGCSLPCIKEPTAYFETQAEAEQYVEGLVKLWFKAAFGIKD